MSLDDELRRVLDDGRLSVPVRPGSEWSLVAAARRRRYRTGALAATGGLLAALSLVGGAVGLVAHEAPEPAHRPAGPPPVVVSSTPRGEPVPQRTQPPRERPERPAPDHEPQRVQPDGERRTGAPEPTRELPSILREPGPPTTGSAEPPDAGDGSTTSRHPTSEPPGSAPGARW